MMHGTTTSETVGTYQRDIITAKVQLASLDRRFDRRLTTHDVTAVTVTVNAITDRLD
jgi:hypothetical protein